MKDLQEKALQKEHRALVNIKFLKQTILVVHQFSNSSEHSNQCFGSGSGLDPNSIGSAVPDPGRPNGPQKGTNEGISCLKSLNVLCRGLRRHSVYDVFKHNIFQLNLYFYKFCNNKSWSGSGSDPYSATGGIRIRIQKNTWIGIRIRRIRIRNIDSNSRRKEALISGKITRR
jgi:hypothetical protein